MFGVCLLSRLMHGIVNQVDNTYRRLDSTLDGTQSIPRNQYLTEVSYDITYILWISTNCSQAIFHSGEHLAR
jgi:hypothetical protein